MKKGGVIPCTKGYDLGIAAVRLCYEAFDEFSYRGVACIVPCKNLGRWKMIFILVDAATTPASVDERRPLYRRFNKQVNKIVLEISILHARSVISNTGQLGSDDYTLGLKLQFADLCIFVCQLNSRGT